ncbi:hypothetical protein CAI21_15395 [Alkalilimnicola ehrlichii]|uniref:Uncharacterized protein n=1 Tax=Alkalilimnicola ehrlichii TaxID=351052 RepID=A0A3E0WTT8_9GAMM|nr:hypothetical protein [Alkalilimnicola ehrlichii]RFA27229.1 hypothetical protein CAI21_15395 [Alkalilimnicola ehrlichii]RFA35405.1 hypothetical protein CAL65_13070 [Alkalilimnicola ehrlichii]
MFQQIDRAVAWVMETDAKLRAALRGQPILSIGLLIAFLAVLSQASIYFYNTYLVGRGGMHELQPYLGMESLIGLGAVLIGLAAIVSVLIWTFVIVGGLYGLLRKAVTGV